MNKKNKNKYETPVVLPLGELAKGSGVCEAGTGGPPPGDPGSPNCGSGTNPSGPLCIAGGGGRTPPGQNP